MKMKKSLMMMIVILSAAAFADEWVWVGGSSSTWTSNDAPYANNANNWTNRLTGAKGYPNSANDIAVFDGDATLRCANDAGQQMFGGMKILRGTVRFLSIYDISRMIQFAASTSVIEIAEGAVLNLEKGPSICGAAADEQVVILTGGGNLIWSGNSTIGSRGDGSYALKDFIVRDFHGGVFDIAATVNANSICILHLADGMTATWGSGADNKVRDDDGLIKLDRGAIMDMNGCGDTLGALVGEGRIVNPGQVTVSLPHAKGPFDFGGSFAGTMKVRNNNTSLLGENSYILLTSSNAFAETTFQPFAYDGGAFLRFAPGVGTFSIGGYQPATGQRLRLEDTDGNPVTVKMALAGTATDTVVGSGDFVYTGTAEVTYSKTALNHTGKITAEGGIVNLGTGTASDDPPLAQYAGFAAEAPGVVRFRNAEAVKLDGAITGDGQIEARGPGEWTAFGMTGGVFNDFSAVTLTAPDARLQQLAVWPNASLVVSGGALAGVGTTGSAAFLALNGAEGTSVTIKDGADVKASALNVRNLSVKDSHLHIWAGLANCGTAGEPQVIRLDGATVSLGDGSQFSADSYLGTREDSGSFRHVYVKEGGVTVVSTPEHPLYGSSIGRLDSETAEGVADGGVTLKGAGWLRLDGPMNITGPLRFLGTFSRIGDVADYSFGGNVEFGTSFLDDVRTTAVSFAGTAGSTVALSGAMTISPRAGSSYAFGAAGAAADSVFTRGPGGVLFVQSPTANPSVTVNGGISDTAASVSSVPVFTYTQSRGDAGAGTDRYHLQFVSLRNGALAEVYGTPWNSSLTANDIALVDSADATVVSADAAVGGIRLFGRNGPALTVGATLAVGAGSAPAAILLNNNHASGRGKVVIDGAGRIDFGAREGIIAANLNQVGSLDTEINCSIAGMGGVTFAAPGENTWLRLGAANTYSGGTRIENISVGARNGASFGSGTVTVNPGPYGCGEVRFEQAAVFGNNFVIGGWGTRTPTNGNRLHNEGAMWFTAQPVELNGSVALLGETWIGGEPNAKGCFNGAISGVGPLNVRGGATIVLKAANTFTGGLNIGSGSTVEIDGAAALGSNVVVVDGTLRIANAADAVIVNTLLGSGVIELVGSGKVTIRDRAGFTGSVVTKGGVCDLSGTDLKVGSLDGTGALLNSGEAATVTIEGTAIGAYAGSVGGDISLVKQGASIQALTARSTYTGATTVEGGTLRLGAFGTSATLPIADDVLHLDAAVGVTLVEGTENTVASWADADGRDFVFSNVLPKAGETPAWATVETRECGPAIAFGAKTWIRLASDSALTNRTIFGVFNVINSSERQDYFAEMIGATGQDSGVRLAGGGFIDVQKDWVNEVSGDVITQDAVQLFTREYASALVSPTTSVSGYSGYKRPWNGDLHEIVVYDRTLIDTERALVNDYLMVKWGLRPAKVTEKLTDVLPSATDVTVGADGVLDLAGNDQTLASLACYGTVTNSLNRVAVLTLTGDSSLAADASFGAPNLDIVLVPGVTLDLGGGEFTVRRVIRNGGRVVNGMLKELSPRGGFVISIR